MSTDASIRTPDDLGVRSPLWLLCAHVLGATLVQGASQAVYVLLPMIALKEFHASETQTVLITAPPTVLFLLSIFWNDFFSRLGGARYLMIFWVVACLPIAGIALAHGYGWLLAAHLLACAGGAGWPPLAGALLKSFYAPARRGTAYSIVWSVSFLVSAVLAWLLGDALTKDNQAFRSFLPMLVAGQAVGVGILLWATKASGHLADLSPKAMGEAGEPWKLSRVLDPILHMKSVLKADPTFARYEGAYMTYGIGWMMAYALLPLIAEKKLGLSYVEFSGATHVPYVIAIVATMAPMAAFMHRFGAVRTTGLSFLLLALYPLMLAFARDKQDLMYIGLYYGVAHAGASVGWMLGPVSLAPSPDKVASYVAIHATLVGVRGALFQFLGLAMYLVCSKVLKLSTGVSLGVPLVVGACAYVWAAWQMRTLHAMMARAKAAGAAGSA